MPSQWILQQLYPIYPPADACLLPGKRTVVGQAPDLRYKFKRKEPVWIFIQGRTPPFLHMNCDLQ